MSKERGGGLIFLVAGIYGLVFSYPLPLGQWNQPGPAVFPLAVSILLCVFGGWWVVQGGGEQARGAATGVEEFIRRYATPMRIVGLTAGFILLLGPLGYMLTSTLYIFILFLWVSRYQLWLAAVLATGVGVGSWLFFEKLLSTPLPGGIFP